MRRTAWLLLSLAGLALLPGCAPEGAAEGSDLARSLRRLSKAIAGLDDERARLAAEDQPAVAGAVAELRLVVHQAERTVARLPDGLPAGPTDGLSALGARTERLRGVAYAGRQGALRAASEEVAAEAREVSASLRAAVAGVRAKLRRPAPDAGYFVGTLPAPRLVLGVRVAAGIYTAAALLGMWAALTARDKLARRRRALNGAVFAGLCASGVLATTIYAPTLAGTMAPELTIPDGEAVCEAALARGAELDRALRIAVEREGREELEPGAAAVVGAGAGARAGADSEAMAGGRSLSRRDLLIRVRGGSERRLLEQPGVAPPPDPAQTGPAPARPSGPALQAGADVLARDVRELAAGCAAFAAEAQDVVEARYYHALAAEYLSPPLAAGPGG